MTTSDQELIEANSDALLDVLDRHVEVSGGLNWRALFVELVAVIKPTITKHAQEELLRELHAWFEHKCSEQHCDARGVAFAVKQGITAFAREKGIDLT